MWFGAMPDQAEPWIFQHEPDLIVDVVPFYSATLRRVCCCSICSMMAACAGLQHYPKPHTFRKDLRVPCFGRFCSFLASTTRSF